MIFILVVFLSILILGNQKILNGSKNKNAEIIMEDETNNIKLSITQHHLTTTLLIFLIHLLLSNGRSICLCILDTLIGEELRNPWEMLS